MKRVSVFGCSSWDDNKAGKELNRNLFGSITKRMKSKEKKSTKNSLLNNTKVHLPNNLETERCKPLHQSGEIILLEEKCSPLPLKKAKKRKKKSSAKDAFATSQEESISVAKNKKPKIDETNISKINKIDLKKESSKTNVKHTSKVTKSVSLLCSKLKPKHSRNLFDRHLINGLDQLDDSCDNSLVSKPSSSNLISSKLFKHKKLAKKLKQKKLEPKTQPCQSIQSSSGIKMKDSESQPLSKHNQQHGNTSIRSTSCSVKLQRKTKRFLKNVNLPPTQDLNSQLPEVHSRRNPATLRERMMRKLQASRFRYLNEQMYCQQGNENLKYFKTDPQAFHAYHLGYRQQVSRWPLNPLDVIINALRKKSSDLVIADFGCGDAQLARSLPNTVHSFDLVSVSDLVTACDMAHTPLVNGTVDVAVFCLSLMGTNLIDYILEANRVLKTGGMLKIAEVESRFENVEVFVQTLLKQGFSLAHQDFSRNLFYFMDFKKIANVRKKCQHSPLNLRPCFYKKR